MSFLYACPAKFCILFAWRKSTFVTSKSGSVDWKLQMILLNLFYSFYNRISWTTNLQYCFKKSLVVSKDTKLLKWTVHGLCLKISRQHNDSCKQHRSEQSNYMLFSAFPINSECFFRQRINYFLANLMHYGIRRSLILSLEYLKWETG